MQNLELASGTNREMCQWQRVAGLLDEGGGRSVCPTWVVPMTGWRVGESSSEECVLGGVPAQIGCFLEIFGAWPGHPPAFFMPKRCRPRGGSGQTRQSGSRHPTHDKGPTPRRSSIQRKTLSHSSAHEREVIVRFCIHKRTHCLGHFALYA